MWLGVQRLVLRLVLDWISTDLLSHLCVALIILASLRRSWHNHWSSVRDFLFTEACAAKAIWAILRCLPASVGIRCTPSILAKERWLFSVRVIMFIAVGYEYSAICGTQRKTRCNFQLFAQRSVVPTERLRDMHLGAAMGKHVTITSFVVVCKLSCLLLRLSGFKKEQNKKVLKTYVWAKTRFFHLSVIQCLFQFMLRHYIFCTAPGKDNIWFSFEFRHVGSNS